ncbi:hypothetical protein ACFE04_026364 [Oxalis oulophora]
MKIVNPKIQFVIICVVLLLSHVVIDGEGHEDNHQDDEHKKKIMVNKERETPSSQQNPNSVAENSSQQETQSASSENQQTPVNIKIKKKGGGHRRKKGGHRKKKNKRLPQVLPGLDISASITLPKVILPFTKSPNKSSKPPPQPLSPPKASQPPSSPHSPSHGAPINMFDHPVEGIKHHHTPDNKHIPLLKGVAHDKEYLAAHNKVRAKFGLPKFEWNETLVAHAQNWANIRRHDCNIKHSNGDYGENIFWGNFTHWTPSEIVQSWASESAYYNVETNQCKRQRICGHYTQIIWRDSERVGCASIECDHKKGLFSICMYDPPGNYRGEMPLLDNIAIRKRKGWPV